MVPFAWRTISPLRHNWIPKCRIVNSLIIKYFKYEKLFNIDNPEQEKNFLSFLNPNSIIIKNGFIEKK